MILWKENMEIRKPDDCGLHLRHGNLLRYVILYSERQFARGIVLPNTMIPITTKENIIEYYDEILSTGTKFVPKMTLHLTDNTKIEDVEFMTDSRCAGCKMYPIGSVVNGQDGISNINKISHILSYMEEKNIPLIIHGEDMNAPILKREREFVVNQLPHIALRWHKLKIMLEHLSDRASVDIVLKLKNVWATITPHHLSITHSDLFKDNRFQPHLYCSPIAKSEEDRMVLLRAATSGNPKFFAATDSAPHRIELKDGEGVSGCFTTPAAIEHYAEAFSSIDKLDKLEDFTSRFGAEFYGWEMNKETITLEKHEGISPYSSYYMTMKKHRSDTKVLPFCCGRYLEWRVK